MALDDRKEANRWSGLAGEFLRGLFRPSLPAALGAVAVSLIPVAALAVLITPERLANIDPGRLMRVPRDRGAYVTVRAFHLREAGDPSVVLIGSSSLMHALVSDEELSALLSAELGRARPVESLVRPQFRIWEVANLVDLLAPSGDPVFLVAISPRKLAVSSSELAKVARRPRMGFSTPAFDEELGRAGLPVPRRTGIYFVDQFRFLIARAGALERVFQEPVERWRYSPDRPRVPEDEWRHRIRMVRKSMKGYETHRDENLAVLGRIVRLAHDRGRTLVLVEAPVNPRSAEEIYGEVWPDYSARIERFAEEHGVPYWNLNAEGHLVDDDFDDWTHLRRREASRWFSRELMTRLGTLLAAESMKGGAS